MSEFFVLIIIHFAIFIHFLCLCRAPFRSKMNCTKNRGGRRVMGIRELLHKNTADFGIEDAYKQIKESKEFARECGFDIEKLHCKGCIYSCPIARAKCDTGKRCAPLFEKCRAE